MKIELITNKRRIMPNFQEIWQQKILLYALVNRNIKLRYKQTLLGVFWVVVQPLALSGVFALIFGQFMSLSTGKNPYLAFSMVSMIIWQLFSRALSDASISLTGFSTVITKVYFPRIMIPLASVLTALFDFLIVFPILLILLYIVNDSIPFHALWLTPGIVFLTLLLSLGLGLCFSSINIVLRDLQHVIPFMVQLGFYLSPVVYSTDIVSAQWQRLYFLNPLVGILEFFRYALLFASEAPNTDMLIYSISFTVGVVIIGALLFCSVEQNMVDRI